MPDYYLDPRRLASCEIQQAQSLGHDVRGLNGTLDAIPKDAPDAAQRCMAIYQQALDLGYPPNSPYREPSTLQEIRQLRPAAPPVSSLSGIDLYDRILGGWLGRCAGCLVGKPVEGWTRQRIRETLQKLNAWPLDDYFPEIPADAGTGYHGTPKDWTRRHITCAPRDDDTDYTIIGLQILEQKGAEFAWGDLANLWFHALPVRRTYTAERVAYINLINGLAPPHSATHLNPYREWIGAQIRADAFGYVAPGRPEFAAELAFKDACISHVANGIYGEMWVAAMLAAAFVTDRAEEVIDIGLHQIPRDSRLTEAIRRTVAWCKQYQDWETVRDRIEEHYGSLHGVHTVNNAALVAMGIMKADGDLGRGICIAVMGGWDTDCNGATAGSVLGVMLGAKKLPAKWTAPLNNTLQSAVFGFATNKISDLAARTLAVARKIGPT